MHWVIAWTCAVALAFAAPAVAQIEGVPIRGDRLGGFVLPVEPGNWNALFKATSAHSWKVDSTQRLFLQGQVNVQLGPYDFYAETAVVWVERIPSAKGVITQFAVWFPQTSEPTKAAGLGAGGSNLLITASTLGETTLRAVLVDPQAPRENAALVRGQARLQEYLRSLVTAPPTLRTLPLVQQNTPPSPPPPLVPETTPPATSGAGQPAAAGTPGGAAPLEPPTSAGGAASAAPIVSPNSVVVFVADRVQIDTNQDTVTLTGGITLDVLPRDPGAAARTLQLRAERGVVFLAPGTCKNLKEGGGGQVPSDVVTGVYLEGDVSGTNFEYTVRAKRAYYDFAQDRATLVEGVLRTVDRATGLPLIARADELRQFSRQQWQSDRVTVSTSEFFTPHLSVGAERATITQTVDDEGANQTLVQGEHGTFRAGNTPLFWVPSFASTGGDVPLRGVGVSYSGDSGARLSTRWDLYGLVGEKAPVGTDVLLYEDLWSNWGVGAGLKGNVNEMRFDGFGMWDFGNVERTSAGVNVLAQHDLRGYVTADGTYELTPDTKLQLQLNYVSDEAFWQTFRPGEFATKFQRETSAYLASTGEHSELGLLLSFPTNDVITNGAQLAARPYQVAKYPEGAYKRWGDSLFDDVVTWTQEYSANLMALRLGEGSENTTGVRRNAFNLAGQAMPLGGVFTPATTLDQLYKSNGYQTDTYIRVYTRQELSAPLGSNGVNFTPFASAAVTGYVDGNPGAYNPAADRLRGLLTFGVRASTDIMANYDSAQIPILDVHRIRHIITPYANGWYGWDSAPEDAYAIYDQDIEGATGGAVVQGGLRQKFQTMRGGPGNWQSVDWLVLDFGATWNDTAAEFARTFRSNAHYRQSPFPQFFAWRPELSQWGRTAYGSFKWAASNTLSFAGNLTYLLDSTLPPVGSGPFGLSGAARGSVGAAMQHTPDIRTSLEYRAINNNSPESIYQSDQLLAGGVALRVSRAYEVAFTPTYDLQQGDFRSFTLAITRETPDFTMVGSFRYDVVVGEYSGGLAIRVGGVDDAPLLRNMPFTP